MPVHAVQALEVSPNSEPMRRMRAEAYMATGQNGEAIGDVTRATKLKSGNVEAYFLLAKLQFQVRFGFAVSCTILRTSYAPRAQRRGHGCAC